MLGFRFSVRILGYVFWLMAVLGLFFGLGFSIYD